MSLNNDNMLSIGSVVKLKDKDLVMVVGFAHTINDVLYDYLGVSYPLGINKDKTSYEYFNNEDIENIEHYGYSTDKDKEYKEGLVELLNKMGEDNE